MKISKYILMATALIFSSNANALFINNGDSTLSDDASGLDWLQLSVTANVSYNDALAANQTQGWRFATNSEVEDMFNYFFPTYTDNRLGNYSRSTDPSLSDNVLGQLEAANNFQLMFGLTYSDSRDSHSFGLYSDETGVLRMAGADQKMQDGVTVSNVYGTDFDRDYERFRNDAGSLAFGSFLVRDAGARPEPGATQFASPNYDRPVSIPEPATLFLFSIGLLGMFGLSRRKA